MRDNDLLTLTEFTLQPDARDWGPNVDIFAAQYRRAKRQIARDVRRGRLGAGALLSHPLRQGRAEWWKAFWVWLRVEVG